METGTLGFCLLFFIILCCILVIALGSRKKCSKSEGFYLPGDLATYLGKDWGAKIPTAYYNPLAERTDKDMLQQGLDPSCGCAGKPWKPYNWGEQSCPCSCVNK